MILKQKFNILENNLKELSKIREWIYNQMDYMKEKDFNISLSKVDNEISRISLQISALKYLMIKYSVFHADEIGPILAEIISTFEGKKFEYQNNTLVYVAYLEDYKKNIFSKKRKIIRYLENRNYNAALIINSEKRKKSYNHSDLQLLKGNGDAVEIFSHRIPLISSEKEPINNDNKKIQFFDEIPLDWISRGFKEALSLGYQYYFALNDKNIALCSTPSFYPYFYIYDFIEFVIDYRITNLKENISLDELIQLKNKFLEGIKFQLNEINENDESELILTRIVEKYTKEMYNI